MRGPVVTRLVRASSRMGDAGSARALKAGLCVLLLLPFLLSWPVPFAIAFAAITVWLVATAMTIVHRPMMQNALVSLASISLCVVADEVFTFVLNRAGPQVTDTLEYSMDDPDLGYR